MNLFIILLVFYVIRWCITGIFFDGSLYLSELAFFTIAGSTLFITAGGYVINDYFDREIDAINKPDKLIVGKWLSLQETVQLHLIFSALGLMFGAIVGVIYEVYSLIIIQLFAVLALFVYAFYFKRKGLSGNLLVALLTAFAPLIAGVYEFIDPYMEVPLSIIYAFAGFAFLFTLIRELTKDLEDMEGDRLFGCRTFPLRHGVKKTKIFISILLVMAIGGIAYAQDFALQMGDTITVYYFLFLVQLPCLYLIIQISLARGKSSFHFASIFIKAIMLFGILYGVLLYYMN